MLRLPTWPMLVSTSLLALLIACSESPDGRPDADSDSETYDVVIRGGTVYDGTGSAGQLADLALDGGRVAFVGDASHARGEQEIDARGLVVAPGFVNMLSWAVESLIEDPRALSDVRQGVTLEVFGEGLSWGPLDDEARAYFESRMGKIHYEIEWTTLGEYLEFLERRGVAVNVASFVGATTLRVHEIGFEDRRPAADELDRMQGLVRVAMEEGALGVGSSLIYAPAFYADTDELVALCEVAAEYDGLYISHLRSESTRLIEAFEELREIAERAGIRAEIYHLKAAGVPNHDKLDELLRRIEAARAAGLDIAANMYTYTAGATGLDAAMPPWVQEGGYEAWAERLRDPEIRLKVEAEMASVPDDWENLYAMAGADGVLLSDFRNDELSHLRGRTLAEVARERGVSPEVAAMDLVIEDGSRVGAIYFLMSEENVRRQIALPWMTFGSDAGAPATEGVFLESSPHPRAYGNFARLLGRYVREEKILTLAEAIHRLTGMAADRLRLKERGRLEAGYHADVVIFDASKIRDHATFEDPHRYATGVRHVFVNGEAVLLDGEPTGATPGQVVRGPGWTGWAASNSGEP